MITVDPTWDAVNAVLAKQPYVALELAGYAKIFTNRDTGVSGHYPWIAEEGITDVEYNTDPMNGTSELQDCTVTVVDYQNLITADMPTITLEGREATIKVWFPGVDYSNALTIFTGRLELVQSSNINTSYDFVLKDARVNLKQLIYLNGNDGQPTSGDHILTFTDHPLDILFDILTSLLHISTADIDVAKILAYRNGPFAGVQFKFTIDAPVDAKDFIENQIMKPLGGCLRATPSGVLTPYFLISLAGTIDPVQSFGPDELVQVPLVNQSDVINTVTYKFDKNDSSFSSVLVRTNATSIAQYGAGDQTVESDGMRSVYQGYLLAVVVTRELFHRYAFKNPTFDADLLFTAARVEVSDIVSITHPLMPDRRAGVLGVTDAWYQVQSLKYDLVKFIVTLTLVDVSFSRGYGSFRVTPDSQTDWTDSVHTTTAQKARYMFLTNNVGKYSDGVAGNPLG